MKKAWRLFRGVLSIPFQLAGMTLLVIGTWISPNRRKARKDAADLLAGFDVERG